MRNSLFRLIKVQHSIELSKSPSQEPESNHFLNEPRFSDLKLPPNILSQKKLVNDTQNSLALSLRKSMFTANSSSNYKKTSSLETSNQEEEIINEGNLQKMVEMQLIDIKFPFPVISPFGKFTKVWNFLIFLIMIYVLTVYPVRLSFFNDYDYNWAILDLFVDCVFMFDMIVNTVTAYEDINGNLVFHLHRIALNYFRTWFWLDLISSLPFNIILQGPSDISGSTSPNIYKLTKILRFFRLIKLASYYTRLSMNFKIKKSTIQLSKLFISTLFLLHITACLWITIAQIEVNPNTWISRYNLNDVDQFTVYIASLYFILTVLITLGYGNITPTTPTEIAFISVVMFLMIGFFGFLMGSLNRAFQKDLEVSEMKEIFFFQMGKDLKIPQKNLSKILIGNRKLHISKSIAKIDAFQKQDIFNDLPFSLQKQLYTFIYQDILEKIDFFHDKPFSFLIEVLPKLIPIFLKKGDEVFKEGDVAHDVYFIMRGRVVSKCLDSFEQIKTVIFLEGGYFGEADIIYKRQRSETAFAEIDTEIWKLDKRVFLKVLKSFKEIKGEVKKLATDKFKYRKNSAANLKSIPKFLLPATYFISKIRESKNNTKKKNNLDNIIKKSSGAMDERKKLEENLDKGDKIDLRKLFMKNDSLKVADKNHMIETTNEDINELGQREVSKFLKRSNVDLQNENVINILKMSNNLAKKRTNLNKKIVLQNQKLDEFLSLLKNLKGILSSQEDELLATLDLKED